MTKREMLQLKPADRVRFSDGIEGEVKAVSKYAVQVDWQDGQSGYIAVEDGEQVSRAEVQQ